MSHTRSLAALIGAALLLGCPTGALAAPSAPKLAAPADDARVETMPVFTWGKVKKASAYEIQIAADAGFGSIITGNTVKTANTAFVPDRAQPDGVYHWRVRAVDAGNKAGKWSAERQLRKQWSGRPDLLAPTGGQAVVYPAQPLVLRWSPVPTATKYIVQIASDPSLAQAVLSKPVETYATSFAVPTALPPGAYYWAVTPVGTRGHKGASSAVGKFVAGWPSATSGSVSDANDEPRAFDPELSWAAIPGAAAYEVEVNYDADWAPGSRVCCTTPSVGTTVSPTDLLPNNTYHWRVRALDVNGSPGQWNVQEAFGKTFDGVAPAIPNLRVRDNLGDTPQDLGTTADGVKRVRHPTVVWDPVPGAGGYEVQVARFLNGACEWGSTKVYRTPATSWTPLGQPTATAPGAFANEPEFTDEGIKLLAENQTYCLGVMAIADFEYRTREDEVRSKLTYIDNGPGAPASRVSTTQLAQRPAFHFEPSEQPAAEAAGDPQMDAEDYLSPGQASMQATTPLLSWKAVPGAKSYWVVIAQEEDLTNPIHVGFTRQPSYSPRITLREQSTGFYWVVLPAGNVNGSGVVSTVEGNEPRRFDKRSAVARLTRPGDGEVISGQPSFRWTTVPGARDYTLQVSTDPTFKDLAKELDTVKTAATSFTPTKVYPVDTALYWRVRGVAVTDDEAGATVHLAPSPASEFRRVLPVPAMSPDNPRSGATIPVLSWTPVTGAVGYDVHVDQADGTRKDFETNSSSFTPIGWYGTGVWTWSVRAVFPGDVHGAYSPGTPFTRFIPAPARAHAQRTRDRVVIAWDPGPMVTAYRVEISDTNSFSRTIDRVDTDHASWAPDLRERAYLSGGTLYWRVATIDDGRNIGAYSSGTLTLARKLVVSPTGALRKGRLGALRIRVTDAGRKPVAGAKVRISGAGISVTRRSSKRGSVSVTVQPRRRGAVTITATKKGYGGGKTTVRAR